MYCSQCGQEIDDDLRFCRHCGAVQKPIDTMPGPEDSAAAAPQGDQPPASNFAIIATAVVLGTLLLLIIIAGSSKPRTTSADDNLASLTDAGMLNDTMTAPDAMPGEELTATPSSSDPWSYSTDEDKVRGATTYFASTVSTNRIAQSAPYDSDTSMTITVRKSRAYGTDVMFRISSGQMMCPSYEGCSATVRFDDGPSQRISLNGPADNSNDTVFVVAADLFIAKLKKAKHVVVEKTLYEAGNPQFEFDVAGLKWDH